MKEINIFLIIILVATIFGFIILFITLDDQRQLELESQEAFFEYGVKVYGDELECMQYCGHTNYYFKSSTTFKQVVCKCDKETGGKLR